MKKISLFYLIVTFIIVLLISNFVIAEQCITQEELASKVLEERKKWDINLDNKYGIEEVIYGLQVISNYKKIETWTNDFGMIFVLIKPGTFIMGSPEGELGRGSDEVQHSVTLTQAFYMQSTEVTQGQWKAVMGTNPSYYDRCGDDCPVEHVSWNKSQEFIEKLNLHENTNRYRLPTEAQWEYAARAGSTSALANGDLVKTGYSGGWDTNLVAMGWYCVNSNGTNPVAQKNSNAWGLYDMHGNVFEWCQDFYGSYSMDSVSDPVGPSSGSTRVIRGGSWSVFAQECRSANRDSSSDYNFNIGLRLLRTVEQE